jgi:hypothetical protein
MSLLSKIKAIIASDVLLAQWLQYVGTILLFGGLIFLHSAHGPLVCYLGAGIELTGLVYKIIYP